jgi:hypothetical protein
VTSRVWKEDVDSYLAEVGHTNYHVRRDSPYTVRVIHDGPEPHEHLREYAALLQALGYRPTIEPATSIRPLRLKLTMA